MIVCAFDPGLTCGWATYGFPDGVHASGQGELDEVLDRAEAFLRSARIARYDLHVVCEAYVVTANTLKKSRQNWSLEGIGVLRYLARINGAAFELQTPADAKSFATDEKLKAVSWHRRGQDHANDASRHLLLYCLKKRIIPLALVTAN